MSARIKQVAVIVVGWTFLVLGVLGLFLPFLQGILFLLIGLIILSSEYVWAHHLLNKIRQRFPKIAHMADEASAKAQAWLRRISGQKEPAQ
jgi:uncharacterized membrane protein YbaN (DUF454 family)